VADESSKSTHGVRVDSWFKQYRSKLERFMARRAHRPVDASDLAQEVYLRLLRFPPERLIERPHAYLYRIASNVVFDFNARLRDAPVTFDSSVADELAAHALDTWSGDPSNQLAVEDELERILRRLPRAPLVALLMHKRDGMTVAEISKQLGVPPDTVKSRIAQAIALCRAATRRNGRQE
jgi:RNA polymerase sigma-70 factor (ECF subfamily)